MLYQTADLYAKIFARPAFYKLNKLLFHMGLRGLGVLNNQHTGEAKFLHQFLQNSNEPTVFDVGANVGNYTQKVMEANPQSHVFAFEPHPKNFEKLQQRFHQNRHVQPIHAGCGIEKSILQLFDYQDNNGSSHATLYREVLQDLRGKNTLAIEVAILSLDDFMRQHQIPKIDLLKIDTEGNELQVLKGAQKTLNEGKIRAIHFEFNSMNLISRVFFRDFYKLLPDYQFFRILPNDLLKLPDYDPIYHELFAFQNVVAIQNSEVIK